MIINSFFGYEAKRKRLLKKVPEGALKAFLSVPFPHQNSLLDDIPLLAVDFETTGLNAQSDKLLSIGFVEIEHRQIKLGSVSHQIINTKEQLDADNVVIHHITDHQKTQGVSLKYAVECLLSALAGKVMLVHFARIEKQFLKQACLELYGYAPIFPVIDTLVLAKRRLEQRDVAYHPSELRLSSLREKYHLPSHFAHNALNDAIATAELLLVQTMGQDIKLKSLL